jgi:hypothetical protein
MTTTTTLPAAKLAAIAWVAPVGWTAVAYLRAHPADGRGPLLVIRSRLGHERAYSGAVRSLPADWRDRGEWVEAGAPQRPT